MQSKSRWYGSYYLLFLFHCFYRNSSSFGQRSPSFNPCSVSQPSSTEKQVSSSFSLIRVTDTFGRCPSASSSHPYSPSKMCLIFHIWHSFFQTLKDFSKIERFLLYHMFLHNHSCQISFCLFQFIQATIHLFILHAAIGYSINVLVRSALFILHRFPEHP